MCMGRPKMVAPPPPPPAPPPPTAMANLSMTTKGSGRKMSKVSQAIRKRRGISSLRITSGTNTNSSGTGLNV